MDLTHYVSCNCLRHKNVHIVWHYKKSAFLHCLDWLRRAHLFQMWMRVNTTVFSEGRVTLSTGCASQKMTRLTWLLLVWVTSGHWGKLPICSTHLTWGGGCWGQDKYGGCKVEKWHTEAGVALRLKRSKRSPPQPNFCLA